MTPVPSLWRYLTTRWLILEPDLARAKWSQAREWRETFMAFDRQTGTVSRDFVTTFFDEVATLPQLMQVVELLMQEKALLGRDGRRIEAALLAQADREGQWIRSRHANATARN